jgi:hypothetical protein
MERFHELLFESLSSVLCPFHELLFASLSSGFAFIFASCSSLARRVMRSLCSSFLLIGDKIDPANGQVRTKIDVLLKPPLGMNGMVVGFGNDDWFFGWIVKNGSSLVSVNTYRTVQCRILVVSRTLRKVFHFRSIRLLSRGIYFRIYQSVSVGYSLQDGPCRMSLNLRTSTCSGTAFRILSTGPFGNPYVKSLTEKRFL